MSRRLYRAPFSTNVERVALALAHKGLAAESVWIDYGDRTPVEEVSGQGLVPVLVEEDGTVVFDSPVILEHLEARHPDPPLFPRDEARREEMAVFVDWFNTVWKAWPNGIEAELGAADPDQEAIEEAASAMDAGLDRFERMLAGREYLFGEDFSAADCIAFPFLKYAARRDPRDTERFHVILHERQSLKGRPRLAAWIDRVDARPRA